MVDDTGFVNVVVGNLERLFLRTRLCVFEYKKTWRAAARTAVSQTSWNSHRRMHGEKFYEGSVFAGQGQCVSYAMNGGAGRTNFKQQDCRDGTGQDKFHIV